MAELYEVLGRADDAGRLRAQAAHLRDRFAERFWWPEEQTYVFALDSRKRQVRSVVSNAGHALWSGIALPDQAWRTASSAHPAFNPFSYQLGAVRPHDNGLITLGLRRHGLVDAALRVAEGILQAASFFDSYHLPELFAGLQREVRVPPTIPGGQHPAGMGRRHDLPPAAGHARAAGRCAGRARSH
jgi:glycogen debranching enzyme